MTSRGGIQHRFEGKRVVISVNTDPLEPIMAFPYLVLTVVYNNIDRASLYQNLRKLWCMWEMLGKVVKKAGVMVRFQVMLYKSVV